MGAGIFIGMAVGVISGAIQGHYTEGGSSAASGLMGGVLGAAGGAAGGAIGGAVGGSVAGGTGSTASSMAASALGTELGYGLPTGYLMATPAASAAAGLGGSFGGAVGSGVTDIASAFLETGATSAVTPTSATGGFNYASLINPAIKVGGTIASLALAPDAPDYPAPIAPPTTNIHADATEAKRFEETPAAIDARNQRERRADEMNSRAKALESMQKSSQAASTRALGGQTFNEYFQKPRTAQERFIGTSPTIGAARH